MKNVASELYRLSAAEAVSLLKKGSVSPLELVEETKVIGFGGGQAILRQGDVLVGGSDSRKDGSAAGF